MITGNEKALLPLQRTVHADGPQQGRRSGWVAQFDASTSGGGAVLRCGSVIVSYTYVKWEEQSAAILGAVPGDSAYQSFWEMVMLLVCLVLWGDDFTNEELLIVGDSTSALQNALDLKGKGIMAAVAREISWRQARFGLASRGWPHPSREEYRPGLSLARLRTSRCSALPTSSIGPSTSL